MQIDFHHGVTYVVARLAGLEHRQASIVAYCAQYVDDATNSGLILFNNGALFSRISSAHKLLDYRNFKKLANYQVWIPFHFLPGNDNLPPGADPDGTFINKLICRPNSHVAQTMLAECIKRRDAPFGLHRLGITMHVYADTWAHQGFAGVNHRVNQAKVLFDEKGNLDEQLTRRVKKYYRRNFLEQLMSSLIGDTFPLGHGAVLSYPDRPYLNWGYRNGLNQQIKRNNPKDFLEAADLMCIWMKRYLLGDPKGEVSGLPPKDRDLIAQMMQSITSKNADERHQTWLTAISEGQFSFGKATVSYSPKGKESWKYQALGTEKRIDTGKERFHYHSSFLKSDWKLFHDALKNHRLFITHELLPQYGICVA